ncbi:ABC transporter ATP-binding protein [Natronomonas gomsonensis]|jgi:NitT/TauT family transport system ATP-binding protein|uniref:ABC transporter ATP-binding protein n=1 Tax=Natronomonas gomsonensis TaxID=1046043 RepID=UPI0020CA88A9|nr:ABC transporter ATP-binding protein [Natronomonas gomsonensis]MCY4730625.1 ABC transporter ATP-binding protein [Natronomonas gomsonensis]
MIEVDSVRKVYNEEVVAVGDVSLSIDEGDFVTVLGPSGCGKSTLLFMLGGFIEPTEGSITVDGASVTGPDPSRGMVFQESVLFPWMSIKKNITWGMKVLGIDEEEREQKAEEYIEMIGLDGFEDAYPNSLSGGMKQRAAMARVLAVNPSVLLMDEPFGALDAQTREMMQHELLDIWNQTGQTCMFVTHSIDEALYLSDYTVVLGSRPSSVEAVVDVTERFGRPRSPEIRDTEEFTDLRQKIWDMIQEEVSI